MSETMSAPRLATGKPSVDAVSADALSSMFQCVAGLRNLRAARAMFTCFLLALLAGGLVAGAGQPGAGRIAVGGLLATVLFFAGIHAAGVLLMDQARNVPLRSVTEAFTYALMCVPRTIGLIVALVLAVVAVILLMAMLFYLSKVPGVGYVLFAVAFPLSVLVAGLTTTAVFLGFQMALAAMWEGASLTMSLARAASILRHRLVESVLLLAVVFVIAGVVLGLVAGVLFFGFWPATAMAAAILGTFSLGGLNAMTSSLFSGSGYALAGGIGAALLWALGLTLVFQVSLLGLNLVYLRVGEGLDSSATQAALAAGVAQARKKAADMGQKAKDAAERARAQAQEAADRRRAEQPGSPAQVAAVATGTCSQCRAPTAVGDLFCGSCGFKLR